MQTERKNTRAHRSFCLSHEEAQALKQMAKQEDKSQSAILRCALRMYTEHREQQRDS